MYAPALVADQIAHVLVPGGGRTPGAGDPHPPGRRPPRRRGRRRGLLLAALAIAVGAAALLVL